MRWGIVLLAVSSPLPAQAMSRNVAISAGSFFAAAVRCEAENLITPGQTGELLKALDPYLTASDKAHMQAGMTRGTKESQVFVSETKRWIAFAPDTASCYRVQGALDDYKAQLGE
jgi:hypothetical protein